MNFLAGCGKFTLKAHGSFCFCRYCRKNSAHILSHAANSAPLIPLRLRSSCLRPLPLPFCILCSKSRPCSSLFRSRCLICCFDGLSFRSETDCGLGIHRFENSKAVNGSVAVIKRTRVDLDQRRHAGGGALKLCRRGRKDSTACEHFFGTRIRPAGPPKPCGIAPRKRACGRRSYIAASQS